MLKEMRAKALIDGQFYEVRTIIIQNGLIANLEVWYFGGEMFQTISPIRCEELIFATGEKDCEENDIFEHDLLEIDEFIYEVMPINTYCKDWAFKGLCVKDIKTGYMVAIDNSILQGVVAGNALINK